MSPNSAEELKIAIQAIVILQCIVAFLIAIIGWFIKRELMSISSKFTQHEDVIFKLNGTIQNLVGQVSYWNGNDRRRGQ